MADRLLNPGERAEVQALGQVRDEMVLSAGGAGPFHMPGYDLGIPVLMIQGPAFQFAHKGNLSAPVIIVE
jgi:hypothetical protein